MAKTNLNEEEDFFMKYDPHSCICCIHLIADIEADIPFNCDQPNSQRGMPINKKNECPSFKGRK
jgi:hypothetical protein